MYECTQAVPVPKTGAVTIADRILNIDSRRKVQTFFIFSLNWGFKKTTILLPPFGARVNQAVGVRRCVKTKGLRCFFFPLLLLLTSIYIDFIGDDLNTLKWSH